MWKTLVLILNKGQIKFGKDNQMVKSGGILFIPGGKMLSVTYGNGAGLALSNDDFISSKELYFQSFEGNRDGNFENFSYINFDAKVFDSVNFFRLA